ncbi:helix-turn-helix domain-containing protein [Caproicibacterium amylolyticum]|jgi:hypothetical protein|uniref:Helix-turn-helix domain-containing protein n=1 Tax=Caproicibacterium amylolyticum TaxID=2766537 RepID=A0A7G9WJT7_9FIRM|nr:helix-turn-helix domain-containing protein [Caproicibacterium amylolyticum]MBE6721890.1 helix-turn-helix domain-containing protein [Oscillospiraceae bacterium]QNO18949.1 helix-turn-helix domain-containing protein [Caproicibacterium amylolyticum]
MKLYKSWNDVPLILRTEDVVTLLGINRTIAVKWCKAGIIPATKKGGIWFIQKADLMKEFSHAFDIPAGRETA